MQESLFQTDLCIAALERALEHAKQSEVAWQEETGSPYRALVDKRRIENLLHESQMRVATEIISYVALMRFPNFPLDAEGWARKALDDALPISKISDWFIGQVAGVADEKAQEQTLALARRILYRVGEWDDHKFEAKLLGCRLSLQAYIWNRWRGPERWRNNLHRYLESWHNNFHRYLDEVRCLDIVIRHADSPIVCMSQARAAGFLSRALADQKEAGGSLTGWSLAPRLQTYKNGRLDIWLRDEELASKVKAILESEEWPLCSS